MPDAQTPRKPRGRRTIAIANLLRGIEAARTAPRADPAGALAFLAGWVKVDSPELSTALLTLYDLKRD